MSSRFTLLSSPATATATARSPPRRRHKFYLSATSRPSTSSSSSRALSHGGGSSTMLVAAQSQPPLPPPPLAAGAVRRDASTGLAFLLFVLAAVMGSFLSLIIFSFPTWRAMQKLEIAVHKLSKVVAEEVPGTLSSLKLSCMEINDLTSLLKKFRTEGLQSN
uniref:Uncharacterized protein n=1 Tax=Leersia perrieri TaxID=77586 RepID=A0A0D9WCI3_9ORYZ